MKIIYYARVSEKNHQYFYRCEHNSQIDWQAKSDFQQGKSLFFLAKDLVAHLLSAQDAGYGIRK
jgi:hypothetical protein